MNILSRAADISRSPGDPKVLRVGPSVRPVADEMTRALGWFSILLGATQLVAPKAITRMLGMDGKEGLVRAFGVRGIATGMTSLSSEKTVGLWARAGGDMLDIATLVTAYRDDNPKKHNVGLALAAVVGLTLIDLAVAQGSSVTHARKKERVRDFSDRSGYPQGLEAARASATGMQ